MLDGREFKLIDYVLSSSHGVMIHLYTNPVAQLAQLPANTRLPFSVWPSYTQSLTAAIPTWP